MGMLGKRANLPVACLPLLAALVPEHHDVTDRRRERRGDRFRSAWPRRHGVRHGHVHSGYADARDTRRGSDREVLTVVGGPMATVEPEELEDLADVIFVGEADVTWPQFIKEWEAGSHASRYEQHDKTEMTTLPAPRLELLKSQHYMFGSMQDLSRMPVHVRVLRYHRHVWAQAASEIKPASARRTGCLLSRRHQDRPSWSTTI